MAAMPGLATPRRLALLCMMMLLLVAAASVADAAPAVAAGELPPPPPPSVFAFCVTGVLIFLISPIIMTTL